MPGQLDLVPSDGGKCLNQVLTREPVGHSVVEESEDSEAVLVPTNGSAEDGDEFAIRRRRHRELRVAAVAGAVVLAF